MSQNQAISFVKQVKELGFQVPKLEISNLGGLNFVSAFTQKSDYVMDNEATAGVDYNPDVAITKALVEYFERQVFSDGISQDLPICSRRHSDGVAAYPTSVSGAKAKARQNAFSEALERFVWASWWDQNSIAHQLTKLEESNHLKNVKIRMTIEAFYELLDLENIFLVEPAFNNSEYSVLILLAKIKGLGYISGGAAGIIADKSETLIRALAELIRHGIGLLRFIETKQEPKSFYEKRLLYFGFGKGNKLVEERINCKGTEILALPNLEVDDEIKNEKIEKLIVTHRCLFAGQPPFVSGDLERLCL